MLTRVPCFSPCTLYTLYDQLFPLAYTLQTLHSSDIPASALVLAQYDDPHCTSINCTMSAIAEASHESITTPAYEDDHSLTSYQRSIRDFTLKQYESAFASSQRRSPARDGNVAALSTEESIDSVRSNGSVDSTPSA